MLLCSHEDIDPNVRSKSPSMFWGFPYTPGVGPLKWHNIIPVLFCHSVGPAGARNSATLGLGDTAPHLFSLWGAEVRAPPHLRETLRRLEHAHPPRHTGPLRGFHASQTELMRLVVLDSVREVCNLFTYECHASGRKIALLCLAAIWLAKIIRTTKLIDHKLLCQIFRDFTPHRNHFKCI